jgi:hypothetical protein
MVRDHDPEQAEARLRQAVRAALGRGWRPGDLADLVGRRLRPVHATVLEQVMGAPHGLGSAASGLGPVEAARVAADLVTVLLALPALPAADLVDSTPPDVEAKVLDRVRALLAKAESTTFEDEATALTAKATELMARHAIDRAALHRPGGGRPAARRVLVEDPYVSAKAQLLAAVAGAHRCRVVLTEARKATVATVFGYADDLDVVEVLFTSLLVQATSAMLAAGRPPAPAGQRSRGFRHAFLLAYATRVGGRLAEVTAQVVDDAVAHDESGSLLPVLAARADEVDAAVDAAVPNLARRRVSASDGRGWRAGAAAGDRADLGQRRVGATRGSLGR